MGKSKKKRDKKYSGEDAARQAPVVHRYTAVEKSKPKEWFEDNKVQVYTRLLQIAVAAVIGIVIFLAYSWIF